MAERIYFDADCLSAFLWTKSDSILNRMYPGRLYLPAQVEAELNKVVPLANRIYDMKKWGILIPASMELGSREDHLYRRMTASPEKGFRIIGSGEAAAIALAKENGGIVASNNLKDVGAYTAMFGLELLTSSEI